VTAVLGQNIPYFQKDTTLVFYHFLKLFSFQLSGGKNLAASLFPKKKASSFRSLEHPSRRNTLGSPQCQGSICISSQEVPVRSLGFGCPRRRRILVRVLKLT
jgi:hypothetical protein